MKNKFGFDPILLVQRPTTFPLNATASSKLVDEIVLNTSPESITGRLLKYCNIPLSQEIIGEEGNFATNFAVFNRNVECPLLAGNLNDHYDLIGAIVIFRHGDRGPLKALEKGQPLNCSLFATDRFRKFERAVELLQPQLKHKDTLIPNG